jgi:hypothetical protein
MSNVLEQLEERRLMAGDLMIREAAIAINPIIIQLYPQPLYVNGTAGNDNIYISSNNAGTLTVNNNGAVTNYTEWLVSKVVVTAGDGNDFVYTYSTVATPTEISGGYGNDNLYGGAANDYLSGGGDTDLLYGAGGNDTEDGGVGGVANYWENTGNDILYGADGNDVLHASDYGNCTFYGGYGDDYEYGYNGADVMNGDAGNDVIYAGANNDVVHGNAGDDWLYGQDGNDKIYGDAGCDVLVGGNGDDVLVAVGGGQNDCLYGQGGYDSFWCDSEATETVYDADFAEIVNGHVHRVSGYMTYSFHNGSPWPWDWTSQGISRDANGQNFQDPTGGANYQNFSNRPLFATGGPNKDDIDQNGLGDCYFLAGLGAVAKADPDRIRQHIVELGDGTYAVQFGSTYIRVDGDLPTNGYGSLVYAGLGTGNSNWAAIMEKAFAYYRRGDGEYHSIESGWMDEAFSAMGVSTDSLSVDAWYKIWNNSDDLWNYVNGELAAGKAVTIGTPGGSPNLVGSHAYMVDRTYTDAWGTRHVVLRNPWGPNNTAGNPYVDLTAGQFYNSISRVQSAWV